MHVDELFEQLRWETDIDAPSVLDWTEGMRVRTRVTDAPRRDVRPEAPARNTVVYGPRGRVLPQDDATVDVVVVAHDAEAERREEAERVARWAVLSLAADDHAELHWLHESGPRRPLASVLVHGDERDACAASVAATVPRCDAVTVGCVATSELAAAAADAPGEVLVLVDAAQLARPGWLRPLVRAVREEGAGVAGPRREAPDGTLAGCGDALFAEGETVGFGAGAPVDDPLFWVDRDVPVSRGTLAISAALLARLGGIDETMPPSVWETDLCLRSRLAGRRVVVRPQSVVTQARPPLTVTEDERAAFARRWGSELARCVPRPPRLDLAAWHRLADRVVG